jgi:hypothetical protein
MFAVRKKVREFFGRRKGDKPEVLPLATNPEILAGEICVQLGHLSEHAIIETLKIVIKRLLPKLSLGHKPYAVNPRSSTIAEMHRTHNQTGGEMV